ncbi:MAG TPA: redox-regulated ATPase YchF, partial [Crenalkalicoccus sp.]|nr:redox-regulated ATPase YchF [Crenalkalicoccus sp.]
DPDVTHVEGSVDPIRDAETVETELMLADLDSLEKRAQGRVLEAAGAPGVEVGAAGSILERAGRRQLLALALSAIVAGEADAAQLAEAVGEAAASVGLKGADAAALLRAAAMGLGMDDAAARIAALAMVQDVAARLG